VVTTAATTKVHLTIAVFSLLKLATLNNNATLRLEAKPLESTLDRLCRHLLHVTTTTTHGGRVARVQSVTFNSTAHFYFSS
jgi:hypothetical protein